VLLPPPSSPLFPYTTLFRSAFRRGSAGNGVPMTNGPRLWAVSDRLAAGAASGLAYTRIAFSTRRVATQFLVREMGRLSVISIRRSEEHTSELQSRENLVCRL